MENRWEKSEVFTAVGDIPEYAAVVPGVQNKTVQLPSAGNEPGIGFAKHSAVAGENITVVLAGSEVQVRAANPFAFNAPGLKIADIQGRVEASDNPNDNIVAIPLEEANETDQVVRALANFS